MLRISGTLIFITSAIISFAQQSSTPVFHYLVSVKDTAAHQLRVELHVEGWKEDSVSLKLPQWTPGYYQLMGYADKLNSLRSGSPDLKVRQLAKNHWVVSGIQKNSITLQYDIVADKKFVAQSYVDGDHAFLLPGSLFMYVPGKLDIPVYITVETLPHWNAIATGLQKVSGKPNTFHAPNFDILYDCPLLAGLLSEIPSFSVYGVPHRFIGYRIGEFDRSSFSKKLQRMVSAASAIIGDIPYQEYTFISIGPGRGGIEHSNNTVISFEGSQLRTEESEVRLFHFLAHEYFHHYNVKRIRPLELGPFEYDAAARTNLLWVSEGLSVYYEYLVVRRANLSNDAVLLKSLEKNIETFENSPGKNVQSLVQASYETWKEGPFGKNEGEDAKTISYYDKGPVVGFLLDLAIRQATENRGSLDDVMRYLYQHFYKELARGFTDAEFQQACEYVAGTSLKHLFQYVYTAAELDYAKYLAYAGLVMDRSVDPVSGKTTVRIDSVPNRNEMQKRIWNGVTGG